MSDADLTFRRLLPAPPSRVFASVTEARHLARWFCDQCESDPRAGGTLRMRWTRPGASPEPFVAGWVEFAPAERAAFRGGHAGYPGGDAGVVTFELTASPDGSTGLSVTHVPPPGHEQAAFVAEWRAAWPRALDRLARYLTPATSGESVPA